MLNLEDFMNIRDLKQQGWSVSAIADELSLDRKTVRKHLLDAPQAYKRENPAPCKIDPYRPFLRERWETGGHPVAGGRARTSLRALRDRPRRAKPDGLGPLRQLGRTPTLRLRSDDVLLAHALHRVHPEPGHPSPAVLDGAWFPLFRRRDRKRAHRPHEDRAARPDRRRVAFQPEVSPVRRLLRLRAPCMPPLPAGDQRQN